MTRKNHNAKRNSLGALVSLDEDLLLELMKTALGKLLEAEMTD